VQFTIVRTVSKLLTARIMRVIYSHDNILHNMSLKKYTPNDEEEQMNIVLYIKKTNNASYSTKHGIEFQCVELIRRFFTIHRELTFPDVVDASDFFKRITEFTFVSNKSKYAKPIETSNAVGLQTYSFPYTRQATYYLRPGSILFWKYRKPDYPYGHVAMIWKNDKNTNETYVVQQNLNPPIKIYNTTELFSKMNCERSKFAGVKLLPNKYLIGIQHLECVIHRL
jgi:hypothetical protein